MAELPLWIAVSVTYFSSHQTPFGAFFIDKHLEIVYKCRVKHQPEYTMIYENATVKYWYRYSHHATEHFDLPVAQMTVTRPRLFNDESFDFAGNTGKMYKADKVWLQVNDEPIHVIKARDGDMKFDEDEFTRMLFVVEQADVVSLAS